MAALVKQVKSRFVRWINDFRKIKTPVNGMNTTIADFTK